MIPSKFQHLCRVLSSICGWSTPADWKRNRLGFQTSNMDWDDPALIEKREALKQAYLQLQPYHPTLPSTLKDFHVFLFEKDSWTGDCMWLNVGRRCCLCSRLFCMYYPPTTDNEAWSKRSIDPKPEEPEIRTQVCSSQNCTSLIFICQEQQGDVLLAELLAHKSVNKLDCRLEIPEWLIIPGH